MEWVNWARQTLPTSGTPAQLAAKAAKTTGFNNPGLILSSSMEEGVGNRFKGDESYSEAYNMANEKGDLKGFPVDGFRSYGLDQIGGRVDEFIKKGYLPKEFKSKMKTFKASNENDEQEYYDQLYKIGQAKGLVGKDFKYKANDYDAYDKLDTAFKGYKGTDLPKLKTSANTAAFADDESAFAAKAAFMRAEHDDIFAYAKKKGYKLTPEEQDFFTLASYNGGPGNGQKMLDYYGGKKELGNNGFLKDRVKDQGQIYDNVLPRYAGGKLFNSEGFFAVGGEAGDDEQRNTDWAGIAGMAGTGLQVANGLMALLENNPTAQSKEPLVNASTVRTMVSPYSKFAMGGEADGAMEQLQAMADEMGITVEQLIAQLQQQQDGGSNDSTDSGQDQEEGQEDYSQDEEETFAVGGITGGVPINAEGGEVIQTPDGQVSKIKGAKHEQGGVDMTVPKGTKIYSDRVEIGGRTMQERKLGREKVAARMERLLAKDPNNSLLKATAQRTAQANQIEEGHDMQLQKSLQAVTQEMEKFAYGGDTKEYGTGGIPGGPDDPFFPGDEGYVDPLTKLGLNANGVAAPINVGGVGNQGEPLSIPMFEGPQLDPTKTISYGGVDEVGATKEEPKENKIGLAAGDYVGLAGNLFNAIAPIINTNKNRAATKPNINRWLGFGEKAIEANDVSQDIAAGTLANKKTDIDTSANTARNRNRNSASSVNTVRALDIATDMGVNKARGGAEDAFAGTMVGLLGQRGQLENQQDQAEMAGQERMDVADKQDVDNYYSQMAQNLTNFGTNIQGVGKALNVNKSNNVNVKLISQLSRYGLTMDEDGNLISTK
jgi:hypothetical protein